jgi:hypothetical protein
MSESCLLLLVTVDGCITHQLLNVCGCLGLNIIMPTARLVLIKIVCHHPCLCDLFLPAWKAAVCTA